MKECVCVDVERSAVCQWQIEVVCKWRHRREEVLRVLFTCETGSLQFRPGTVRAQLTRIPKSDIALQVNGPVVYQPIGQQ